MIYLKVKNTLSPQTPAFKDFKAKLLGGKLLKNSMKSITIQKKI